MQNAYVYYRIDLKQAKLASSKVDALLFTMSTYCGQPPHRLERCDDPATWMEIYPDITDFVAFSTALKAETQTLGQAEFILGERHFECFSEPDIPQ